MATVAGSLRNKVLVLDDVTTGDLTVTGSVTISGTATTLNSTNTSINDSLIELNAGLTGSNPNDLGLILERGSTGNNVFIGWDESADKVVAGLTTSDGTATGNLSLTYANFQAAGATFTGNVDMASGHASGKFAVKSSGVHNSFDFYNNGTSYFNGQTEVNAEFRISSSASYITHFNYQDGGNNIISQANSGSTTIRNNNGTMFTLSSAGNLAITGSITSGGNTVWHSGNDGSGSTLDADLLDGQHGSYYRNASNINAGTLASARLPGHMDVGGQIDFGVSSNYGTTTSADRLWISSHTTGQSDVPGSYHDIINLSSSALHGIQIASGYGATSGSLYMRTRSDNTNAPAGQGLQAWNKLWHSNNDGSGSGLDADTVDGLNSGSFLRSDAGDTHTGGTITLGSGSSIDASTNDRYLSFRVIRNAGSANTDGMYIGYGNSGSGHTRLFGGGATTGGLYIRGSGANDLTYGNNTGIIWHAANDGSGSGLDADLLDGKQGADLFNFGYAYSSNTITRAVGSGAQWYKVASFTSSVKHITMKVSTSGDNTIGHDSFFIAAGSYGMKAHIIRMPSSKYNGTKLEEVRTKWVSGATYELWVKVAAITTSAGTLKVSMNDSGVTSSLSAGTEPTVGSADNTLPITASDRVNYSLQATGKIEAITGFDVNGSTVWHAGNDGSGSGLDADTLDGFNLAENGTNVVLRSNGSGYLNIRNWINVAGTGFYSDTYGNHFHVEDNGYIARSGNSTISRIRFQTNDSSVTTRGYVHTNSSNYIGFLNNSGSWLLQARSNGNLYKGDGQGLIWHAANDGSGSGLDSDLLDGQHGGYYLNYNNFTNTPSQLPANGGNSDTVDNLHAASFLRSDAADTASGTITFSGGINGFDINNGISGTNFNISGVNALTINDPGEGIIFGGGSNTVSLYAVDDSNDNIMKFDGAAKLLVANDRVVVASERDLATNSTGTSSTDFVTVYNVNGNNLASQVRLSVTGTTGNVVVNCVADILVNHSQDIFVSSMSGNYTQLDIKVTSNNNEDFAIECRRTDAHSTQATLRYSLIALSQDTTISQPNSHSYTGRTLTHRTKAGSFQSATDGAGDAYFNDMRVAHNIFHDGDTDTKIVFDNNRIRLYAGGTVKIDTNNNYLTSGDGNNYLTGLSFNTGNGIITASRTGLSDVTVDLDNRYAYLDHFRHTGHGNYTSTTTSALLTEALGDDAFDSKLTAHKTSWSYAGNGDLTDAGRLTELAGTSWLWWTDNSTDNVQGNITGLAIAPTTGGSAGKMFVYNNQGSGYAPGWREIWTSTSDGSGSGLDADTVDGIQGASLLRSDASDTASGQITFTSSAQYPIIINASNNGKMVLRGSSSPYIRFQNGTTDQAFIQSTSSGLELKNQADSSSIRIKDSVDFSQNGTTYHSMWHAGNDGSGSGLDADTLDGEHKTKFMQVNSGTKSSGDFNNFTDSGNFIISNHANISNSPPNSYAFGLLRVTQINGTSIVFQEYITHSSGEGTFIRVYWNPHGWTSWRESVTFSSDGSGSGLDADSLDGINSSSFLRSDANDSSTGVLTLQPSANRTLILNRNIASPSNYYNDLQLEVRATSGTAGIGLHRNGYSHVGIYTNTSNRLDFDFNSGDVIMNHNAGTLWGSGNDGSGSGLDADTLDGVNSASFARSDAGTTYSNYGNLQRFYSNTNIATASGSQSSLECFSNGSGNDAFMTFHVGGDYATYFGLDGGTNKISTGGWSAGATSNTVWHAGSDGSGSGLDADTLDGTQRSSFLYNQGSGDFRNNPGGSNANLYLGHTPTTNVGSAFINVIKQTAQYAPGVIRFYISPTGTTNSTSNTYKMFEFQHDGDFHADGDVTAFSATTGSDRKLKKNIRDLEGSLDKTLKLRGVKFDWKEEKRPNDQLGFIAQEVQEVLPEVVKEVETLTKEDETHLTVNYPAVVPLLVEAIKEQQSIINRLEERLSDLESKLK